MTLTNRQVSELAAIAAQSQEDNKQKALRRCSHLALMWDEEAADVLSAGRALTELEGIGKWLDGVLTAWLEDPPEVPLTPPVRTDFLTYAEALAGVGAEPGWRGQLRGDLQMHTTYSDGRASISEMALAARTLGYEYIAITDHSKGLKIAGGMNEAELLRQSREIDGVNAALAGAGEQLHVLRALEMNVNLDGEGDMEDDALDSLDLILGSFHSKLRITDDQTSRYVAALHNPHVHVLGHPRGRKYNFRLGLAADWQRVFETAAELDKAVEIDGYPDRQDLNVELLVLAREAGVRISIGTDAHNQSEMRFIDVGLAAALKAGIDRDRILNFQPWQDIVGWTESLRAG
ncbi:MAG: putative hydrolase [Actinomycetota bacterium]|jgi:histidinol phosphatase-like PHP family hydrolase|nr:putative hydrolase [Actinomycetota bacterium]